MRRAVWHLCLAVAAAGAVTCALGQPTNPLSATKPDPVGRPTTGDAGWLALVQMLGAVVVVGAGVKWVLPKWLKAKPGGLRARADGSLRLLETVPSGTGAIQIVEAMGRQFLVASGSSGTTLLAELTPRPFETLLHEVPPQELAHVATEAGDGIDIKDRVAAASARLDELIGH